MSESYKKSNVRLIFDNGSGAVDLTNEVNGPIVLRGNTVVPRFKRQGTGEQGVTADGVGCGFQITAPCYMGTATRSVMDSPKGNLIMARTDGDFGYAFEAVVSSAPGNSTFGGANTITLTFMEGAGREVVASDLKDSDYTLTADQVGYKFDESSNAVEYSDSGQIDYTSGDLIVAGDVYTAEKE